MIESYIRPGYQKLLVNPVLNFIEHKTRWRPNHITFAVVISGLIGAVFIALSWPIVATLFILFSGYCDSLDGSLARRLNASSAVGTVFDIVGDRIVEFAIIFGLFSVNPAARGALTLWMLGATLICVTSFLVVGLFTENESQKSFHYSVGLMERPEAFAFFIAMVLFPSLFTILAIVYTVLVLATAAVRVWQYKNL